MTSRFFWAEPYPSYGEGDPDLPLVFARVLRTRPALHSPLVLAKIGHDLRQGYSDVIEQPLPEELQRAVEPPPLKSVE